MASTINAKNTSTGVVITPDASGQLELQTADTTRMTITSSGNVGIGTSSPVSQLNMYKGAGVANYLDISGNGNTLGTSSIAYGQDTSNVGYFWNRGNAGVVVGTNNLERMRITSNGGVAFGGASNFGTSGQVLQSNGDAAPSWVDSRGMTLLGTLTTTSGTTQTLSGLTLTNYKLIIIAINRTSHNSGTSQGIRLLDANGSTQLALAASTGLGAFTSAIVTIDLATGVLSGTYDSTSTTPPYSQTVAGALCGKSTFSTSATSLQFSYSGGSFDAGTITVYGVS